MSCFLARWQEDPDARDLNMKLGDICAAPCFQHAHSLEIPKAGYDANRLKFGHDGGCDFYAILLSNHDPRLASAVSPKLAIVGLSPAGSQIGSFVSTYAATGAYGKAQSLGRSLASGAILSPC